MRKVLFALAAFSAPLLALSAPASAIDVKPSSLMGRWCGDGINYTFSRSALVVTKKGAKPAVLPIKGIGARGGEVQVFFKDPYGGGSRFAEFGPDGRTMAQQSSPFGSMPRRAFRRC
ncbi:MAG: hypothetical protein AB7K04_08640 [Pseudorhodoplanes sp.]